MIAFIVALDKEAQPILKKFLNLKQEILAGKPLYKGEYLGKSAVMSVTNIGKVSSAMATQAVIDKFNPEIIINYGVCGGIKNKVEIKKFYLVDESMQYDLDLRDIDKVPLGYNQGYDKVFFPSKDIKTTLEKRKLATADKFTSKKQDIIEIEKAGCSLYDMEGGAISQVAYGNNVPFICIKGVSDVFGSKGSDKQYFENLQFLCKNFPVEIEKIIKEI